MRRLLSGSVATLVASVALLAGIAGAQPEPWQHPDGSMHYYHAMSTPDGINWNFAWDSALGHGGYLATITSQSENDFIFSLIDSSLYWQERPGTERLAGPWIGGTQYFGSPEPDSGWHWVTDESMGYVNWSPGQPDNQGNENALHFGESVDVRVTTWNDASCLDDSIRGFVRELSADSTTLGLKVRDSGFYPGYTLFAPQTVRREFLIDDKGRPVHSWPSTYPHSGRTVLLENGLLFRGANLLNPVFKNGGRVELVDWDGNVVWGYSYSDSFHCQHHDAMVLPNGHVLMIAFELKTKEEAIAAGRDTTKLRQGKLWPEHLVEVDPANNNNIVWEWHLWDHLIQDYDSTKANYGVVGDHPELVDLNFFLLSPVGGNADWVHANGLDYNAEFDQVILSAHNFGEAWVIDHSTTTQEAAGHTGGRQGMGGDLTYRWGNPWAYRRGDSLTQQLFAQHNTQWIHDGLQGAGHMMAFSNGWGRPGGRKYSTVIEWVPPCDSTGHYTQPDSGKPFGPDSAYWIYEGNPDTTFYSRNGSGAQRLPTGNTLICEQRNGRIFEVAPDTRIVWTYVNPMVDTTAYNQGDTIPWDARGEDRINGIFRAYRYAAGYPGLYGKTLVPDYPLERYSTKQYVAVEDSRPAATLRPASAWPNPFTRQTRIDFGSRFRSGPAVDIFAVDGRHIRALTLERGSAAWDGTDNTGRQVSRGIYCCRVRASETGRALKLIKLD